MSDVEEIGEDIAETFVEGGDLEDIGDALGEGLAGMAGGKLGSKLGKKLGNKDMGKDVGNFMASKAGGAAMDFAKDNINLGDKIDFEIPDLPDLPDLGGGICKSIFGCFSDNVDLGDVKMPDKLPKKGGGGMCDRIMGCFSDVSFDE